MARFEGFPGNIRLGNNVHVDAFASFYCHEDGNITIGDDTYVGDNAVIHTGKKRGHIAIGRRCTVQASSIIYGHGGCEIGDDVRMGAHCVVIPANHRFDDPDRPVHEQGLTMQGIRIENDIWFGAGVIVLDGVTIGTGSVVGAGSVVTQPIGPSEIVAGVPARLIRLRAAAETRPDASGRSGSNP